jgi:hypothetical protein
MTPPETIGITRLSLILTGKSSTLLNSQPADVIEDVYRFQFPSEDVSDKKGEELPAFVGGLIRKQEPAQLVDPHLASQKQRPDRPE